MRRSQIALTVLTDLLLLAGCAAAIRGAYLAWPPASWMLGGVLAIAFAIAANARKTPPGNQVTR